MGNLPYAVVVVCAGAWRFASWHATRAEADAAAALLTEHGESAFVWEA